MKMAEVNLNKLTNRVTVTVKLKGEKILTMRLRIGLCFVRFGIWITGMNFKYDGLHEIE